MVKIIIIHIMAYQTAPPKLSGTLLPPSGLPPRIQCSSKGPQKGVLTPSPSADTDKKNTNRKDVGAFSLEI